jgi:hypothetical protein
LSTVLGVDRQLGHDLLDGRQLIALAQQPEPQRVADLLHDLLVGRDARAAVQVELDHLTSKYLYL